MAIQSMTGFGTARATRGPEEVVVEAKSVNGKFCEPRARLPRELAALEGDVVRRVKDRLARGSIDVAVRRGGADGASPLQVRVDAAAVEALVSGLRPVAERLGLSGTLGISDLLGIEGVVRLEERPPDLEAAKAALFEALSAALDQLVESRRREGASLAADLHLRLGLLRSLRARAGEATRDSVGAARERLRARVQELLGEVAVDAGRLEQEIVFIAERSDVTEELVRLGAHLDEFDRLLAATGPVGRQLDFLIQEVNREVNTTGSKSQSTELARIVVEMKAEIERLREQVQNVE